MKVVGWGGRVGMKRRIFAQLTRGDWRGGAAVDYLQGIGPSSRSPALNGE
jgi:hypothetical protein